MTQLADAPTPATRCRQATDQRADQSLQTAPDSAGSGDRRAEKNCSTPACSASVPAGLGCPIALYLAAAGVGTIGLADIDVVSPSNLQRQIFVWGTNDVGEDKVKAAAKRLKDLNPDVKLIEHKTIVDSSNVLDLVAAYDIIIDGTDNFPTRYCVNDACVILKKPNVYGSIFRFEGMVTVFAPHLANPLRPGENGPCYRCMYPEPPDPGSVPSCAEGACWVCCPASSEPCRRTK